MHALASAGFQVKIIDKQHLEINLGVFIFMPVTLLIVTLLFAFKS